MVVSPLLNDGSVNSISSGSAPSVICALQTNVGVPETGVYDELTVAAVENFQIRKKLPVTGDVDSATFDALFPPLPHPEPTTILMRPNVTVSGNLEDNGQTVKLCQVMLQYIPTGYLDDDTKSSLEARGYNLDSTEGITELQSDLNSGTLKEQNTDSIS